MTIETYNMEIERYRTPDGKPTCAVSFPDNHVCIFHVTTGFGTRDSCYWLGGYPINKYGEGDEGFMKPDSRCPIWGDHE